MRRQVSLTELVFHHLYPNPKPSVDPSTWSTHVRHHLIKEVRLEVQTFYGDPIHAEARYPGLDYTYQPHRRRLGRFMHHRLLFRAFEELGLTDAEINEICIWEGTLTARRKYEREKGVTVRDTTGDDIPHWDDPGEQARRAMRELHRLETSVPASALQDDEDGAAEEEAEDTADLECRREHENGSEHEAEEEHNDAFSTDRALQRYFHMSSPLTNSRQLPSSRHPRLQPPQTHPYIPSAVLPPVGTPPPSYPSGATATTRPPTPPAHSASVTATSIQATLAETRQSLLVAASTLLARAAGGEITSRQFAQLELLLKEATEAGLLAEENLVEMRSQLRARG